MKILIHDYAGHPFQVQLSRNLAQRGHEVLHAFAGGLITPRGALERTAADPASFLIQEVPMDPEYRENKYNFLRRRGMEVAYGKKLGQLITQVRPQAVLSANTPTEPLESARAAAAACGARFIPWVQDLYAEAVSRLAKKRLPVLGAAVGGYYRWIEAKTLRQSDWIVCISDDFLPILRRYRVPLDKVTVIPNWAPLDEMPAHPKSNPWSIQHGLDPFFCIVYSGTLAMKHNPALLSQLAVDFKPDPAVRVVIISEGPGIEWLRGERSRLGLSNLVLMPFQPFNMLPLVLGSADVLVAILEKDAGVFSVPSKVLSYLCAGRALLGAIPAANLAARIIRETGAGACVEPDNLAGFSAAAATLRAEPATREASARQARAYAVEHFDIKRIADLFEKVLGRPRTSA